MPKPLPTQLSGARFLAENKTALLADEPRVGKTGAAIIAADYIFAEKVLVVTTASGRPVWKRGIKEWSAYSRRPQIFTGKSTSIDNPSSVIIGWPSLASPSVRLAIGKVEWDLVILDESHYAKNIETKRTIAAYGEFLQGGLAYNDNLSAVGKAKAVWCLSGTPIPHAPNDLYPMMRALCPARLHGDEDKGWPDVTAYRDFLHRYCIVKMKKISNFWKIPVVIGGRNLEELKARLEGFILRRTQADVGIRPPTYEIMPLTVSESMVRRHEKDLDRSAILAAAQAGNTKALEIHLGPLRRLTGEMKAQAVIEAVKDEFDCGLDKIVLMFWHTEVGSMLRTGLAEYGVVGIDGSSSADQRDKATRAFQNDPKTRVFVGQNQAAGEAIDLSAAAMLWFVECSFSPKDQFQAALRVTNHMQTRNVFVRVCTLENSIDEAIQASLIRLWSAIREVLQ